MACFRLIYESIEFANESLSGIHLCLHAAKLDKGIALKQLKADMGYLSQANIDKDFIARSRLADSLTNYVSAESLSRE